MNFWKMHGLGNDYIVMDNREDMINDMGELAKRLCRRRYSVGADGLLLVCDSEKADIRMRIINADGSEAEMCGNGIRCFAIYCFLNGIVEDREMNIETQGGLKTVWLEPDTSSVKVNMDSPSWDRKDIPVRGEGDFVNRILRVGEHEYEVTCLSLGNPHCVLFVEDVDNFPVHDMGPRIETHEMFPKRINVIFAQVLGENSLKLRVWERGVGETQACGTGACAAVAASGMEGNVTVRLPGGELVIENGKEIFMTGPAEKVFEGRLPEVN